MRVLIAGQQQSMLAAARRVLAETGFAVDVAVDSDEADLKARGTRYDVILLDVELPHKDGLTLIREWRLGDVDTHVLMLGAPAAADAGVRGLNAGADDYLSKPFRLEELLARVRTLVRRSHGLKSPIIRSHDLLIDTVKRTVQRAGQEILLTPREYGLLEVLAMQCGRVLSRTMIWEHLYDEQDETTSNVVDVYIGCLRKKIDRGFDPPLILTRRGEGYLLREDEAASSAPRRMRMRAGACVRRQRAEKWKCAGLGA